MQAFFVYLLNTAVHVDRYLCLESCHQILQIRSTGCESFLRQTEVSRLFPFSLFSSGIHRPGEKGLLVKFLYNPDVMLKHFVKFLTQL